jgi:hypothetical protein
MKIKLLIPLFIYPFDIMVMMGYSDEEVREELNQYEFLSEKDISLAMLERETVRGRTVLFETNQTFIRMPEIPVTPFDYGILQHEIFHAVTYIMYKVGMKLKIGYSDEAYSYLVGYLTEKIYTEIAIFSNVTTDPTP